ncbi:energy transducer TonB [Roseateles sp. DB2]|uniref:energy transducer TonB n=1 Tax=Roseateles sp. DB2 TaxID=3453717 RepID=UPI003EED524F
MSTKLYSATALALACQLLFCVPASGQTAEPAGKAGSASGISDSDRAKRDADKVLQWIKFHATHSAKPEAPAPAPKPAQAAKAPAPKPGNAPAPATAQAAQAAASVPAPAASQEQQLAASREPESPAPKPELVAAAPATPPAPPATEPARPAPQPEPEEEVALRLIQKVDPDIPRQLANNIRNGSVMVRFMVKPDGSTTKVEALGSANKRLASSAIAAVQQWKFAPIPKPREATVEIGFKLD